MRAPVHTCIGFSQMRASGWRGCEQ